MRIRERERAIMRRRQRQHKSFFGSDAGEAPLGRFRKKAPLDCGHSGCQMCHHDKVHGVRSPARRRADEAFASQLRAL